MAGPSVQVSAAKTDRSLVAAPAKRRTMPDVELLFWRRLIDSAVADAKRTHHGLPTYTALLALWWLRDHQPAQDDVDEWERSFACACGWLNLDHVVERKRLLDEIRVEMLASYERWIAASVSFRMAAVLGMVGVASAIDGQYVMPLVGESDVAEHVAGTDYDDPVSATRQLLRLDAAA